MDDRKNRNEAVSALSDCQRTIASEAPLHWLTSMLKKMVRTLAVVLALAFVN